MNVQIASAAQQQGAVSEDNSKSSERIRELTDQAASAAKQTSTSSSELAQVGEDLKGVVSRFQLWTWPLPDQSKKASGRIVVPASTRT